MSEYPVNNYPVNKSDKEWRQALRPDRYLVLRKGATEAPFSGELYHVREEGVFTCAGCGAVLFNTEEKFDSGCGWPSFDAHLGPVLEREDTSHGMRRTEVACTQCGGHLGHVFDDGPTETGLRYCINSLSLEFSPEATQEVPSES
jgi:methionine-R-sulfoxide reductase